MVLVAIGAERRVPALLIALQRVQDHPLCETVCLVGMIRSRPIHGALKLFHRLGRKLYFTLIWPAALNVLQVCILKNKSFEVSGQRRVTEFAQREEARNFAKGVNIGRKFR